MAGEGEELDMERLRPLAATALESGLGFVEAHGNPIAKLRAAVLLEASPVDRLVDALAPASGQESAVVRIGQVFSGPLEAELDAALLPEPILAAFETLLVLADQRALHADAAERAAVLLASAQQEDGSWGPEPAAPGEAAECGRLFVTGSLAGLLGRTRFARPSMMEGASDFLAGRWKPERIVEGGWSELAAFASWFANVPSSASDAALQWCGRELERGYRAGAYGARETVRVLLSCNATALPGAQLDFAELLAALLGEQAADGGFGEGGPSGRVGPTFDAMLGLLELCRAGASRPRRETLQ